MAELFIDKTIEIKALPVLVWDVLTKRIWSDQWSGEFMTMTHLESDWKLGAQVAWVNEDGDVLIDGTVVVIDEPRILQFTAFDTGGGEERISITKQDGITFELTPREGKTFLHVRHGSFASHEKGKREHHLASAVWDKVLPKIKRLSEKT